MGEAAEPKKTALAQASEDAMVVDTLVALRSLVEARLKLARRLVRVHLIPLHGSCPDREGATAGAVLSYRQLSAVESRGR